MVLQKGVKKPKQTKTKKEEKQKSCGIRKEEEQSIQRMSTEQAAFLGVK